MMTSDDGYGAQFRTSSEDFRAKVNALLQHHRVRFLDVCSVAGVDPNRVRHALEEGTYGLPKNQDLLHKFMSHFGLGVDWLINGCVGPLRNQDEQRLRLRRLVWDFILRDERFPWQHRQRLIGYVMSLLDEKPQHTLAIAARSPIPRTTTDVAFLYERLVNDGFFDRKS